jgi:hypothetical protein
MADCTAQSHSRRHCDSLKLHDVSCWTARSAMAIEPSSNVGYLTFFGIIYLYHSSTNYTDRRHKTFEMLCMKMKIGEGEAAQQASSCRQHVHVQLRNTGRFIMFSVITNIYNKKTKESTLMELFITTGKLKCFFFWQLECSMCAPRVARHTLIRY